jgi:hypothetical protein
MIRVLAKCGRGSTLLGGVEEAEHEQMVEGTRESVKRERELGDSWK